MDDNITKEREESELLNRKINEESSKKDYDTNKNNENQFKEKKESILKEKVNINDLKKNNLDVNVEEEKPKMNLGENKITYQNIQNEDNKENLKNKNKLYSENQEIKLDENINEFDEKMKNKSEKSKDTVQILEEIKGNKREKINENEKINPRKNKLGKIQK